MNTTDSKLKKMNHVVMNKLDSTVPNFILQSQGNIGHLVLKFRLRAQEGQGNGF